VTRAERRIARRETHRAAIAGRRPAYILAELHRFALQFLHAGTPYRRAIGANAFRLNWHDPCTVRDGDSS